MSERITAARFDRIREAIEKKDFDGLPGKEGEEALQVAAVMSLMLLPDKITQDIITVCVNEYGLSESRAYERLHFAREILGDVMESNRKVDQLLLYQRTENIYQKALEAKDYDTALASINTMVKIKGLDREESAIDPKKLEGGDVILRLPAVWVRLLNQNMSKGVLDFGTIDIPHQVLAMPQLEQGDGAAGS